MHAHYWLWRSLVDTNARERERKREASHRQTIIVSMR
jgi:hypothetical protein